MNYIVFALLTDGAAVAAFLLFSFPGLHTPTTVIAVMWLVWIFLLTALPKIFYLSGCKRDLVPGLVLRRRVTVFRWIYATLSLAFVTTMICGATFGRTKLRVEELEICSARIPAGFDGYRIVHISDIHTGTMCRPERRLSRLAEAINALNPDMVVHTGDLVNIDHRELTPEAIGAFSKITAPDGVWSVWGNHDLGFYIKDTTLLPLAENHARLAAKVDEMGWRILSDESTLIHKGLDSILLSGVDYPTKQLSGYNNTLGGTDLEKTFRGLDPTCPYSVVLAHTPELWGEITKKGFGDLTLSGHTHAMQTKISILGRKFSPASWVYDHWSGKYTTSDEKSLLYVNDGIGCVGYPVRIGARPEITVFTLKQCE